LADAYKLAGKAAEMTFSGVADATIVHCYELLKDCELRQSKEAIELKNKSFEEMYNQVIK
jgi:hypothetical protein